MRAMVFTRPGAVEMLDVPEAEEREGESIVEVRASGICGSELHGISKVGFRQPPLVMGHEFAGMTADGRRVVVNPLIACGTCDLCIRDRQQLCRSRSLIGIHRAGGFSDRVSVPSDLLEELPEGVDWDRAALIEPLANAVHAWSLAATSAKSRIAVLGAGTIGLMCQLVAQDAGAEVTVVDLSEERRSLAAELGARATAASLSGEHDVVIDAVGAPATHAASVATLAPGGRAVWIGLLSADSGFDAQELVRQEKTVLGSFAYNRQEFREAVVLARRLELGWSTPFPLARGAEIFNELLGGRKDVVKAILHP